MYLSCMTKTSEPLTDRVVISATGLIFMLSEETCRRQGWSGEIKQTEHLVVSLGILTYLFALKICEYIPKWEPVPLQNLI